MSYRSLWKWNAVVAGVALGSVLNLAAAQAAAPIKIGFVGGISGPCGGLVGSELKAVRLGVAQLNKAGGLLNRKIELIVRDSKTRPDEGAKLARDLIVNQKVDVLTGVCSSAVLLAMTAVSGELKVPLYATVANTQRANIQAFQPYFWQTQANALGEATAAAEFVAQHKTWKKVVPMGFDYEWGRTSVKTFVKHLKTLRPDMVIADPIYPKLGEANMTSYITAALAQKPDVIYAAVFGSGLINLVKQGKSYGLFKRSNLVTLMTVDVMQSLGKAMPDKGIDGWSRAPFYELMGNPKTRAFVKAFRAKYNKYPDDWAMLGYDGLMFYADVIRKAGSVAAPKVIKALTEVSYNGLRGKGMTVRALDHQMSAPVWVGVVTKTSKYPFPIMTDVIRVGPDKTMPSVALVKAVRAKAKKNN